MYHYSNCRWNSCKQEFDLNGFRWTTSNCRPSFSLKSVLIHRGLTYFIFTSSCVLIPLPSWYIMVLYKPFVHWIGPFMGVEKQIIVQVYKCVGQVLQLGNRQTVSWWSLQAHCTELTLHHNACHHTHLGLFLWKCPPRPLLPTAVMIHALFHSCCSWLCFFLWVGSVYVWGWLTVCSVYSTNKPTVSCYR